eukprot:768668-Hanusia_phi.AAC.7
MADRRYIAIKVTRHVDRIQRKDERLRCEQLSDYTAAGREGRSRRESVLPQPQHTATLFTLTAAGVVDEHVRDRLFDLRERTSGGPQLGKAGCTSSLVLKKVKDGRNLSACGQVRTRS